MDRPSPSRASGVLAVLVTSLLWGTTGTAATFASDAGPLAIGAAALGIAGLLHGLIALPALRGHRELLLDSRGMLLAGTVAVAIYPLAFYSSMHLAGVAIGSVASLASAPLASGALERVLEARPLSRWWLLAVGLGVVGSTLLCTSGMGVRENSGWATAAGIALGLVAGASYATYSWVLHRLMARSLPRQVALGSVFGAGGLMLMPVLAMTGAPLLETREAFLVAAYMALVPMFLGYLLFGYGLTHIPASTATTITLTEPAVATVLAVFIVGERLTATGWAGLGIIAVVLVLLTVAPTNRRRGVVVARGAAEVSHKGLPVD